MLFKLIRIIKECMYVCMYVCMGRRMPWANRLFSKSMKILNFLHRVEKMILVIFVQV